MTPLQSTSGTPNPQRQRNGGQKDEGVLQLQYLRMVNVIRSLELFLQGAPIPLHAAADGTGQVTLTVQVTCGDTGKGVRKQDGTGDGPARPQELQHCSQAPESPQHVDQHSYMDPGCVRQWSTDCSISH